MPTETHLKILKHIQTNPNVSQRQLAEELGVSVGKVNYCLRSLIDKGFVKASNFKRSTNKLSYLYLLTPSGIEKKTKLTLNFMKIKMQEFDDLKKDLKNEERKKKN